MNYFYAIIMHPLFTLMWMAVAVYGLYYFAGWFMDRYAIARAAELDRQQKEDDLWDTFTDESFEYVRRVFHNTPRREEDEQGYI